MKPIKIYHIRGLWYRFLYWHLQQTGRCYEKQRSSVARHPRGLYTCHPNEDMLIWVFRMSRQIRSEPRSHSELSHVLQHEYKFLITVSPTRTHYLQPLIQSYSCIVYNLSYISMSVAENHRLTLLYSIDLHPKITFF